MMHYARTAALVIAISLPASVAIAQPRTWTLWEVSEVAETKRIRSTFGRRRQATSRCRWSATSFAARVS
jgi:hypothetical protein